MDGLVCPDCPKCGHPPAFVLAGGVQAFCGNDGGCDVICWNPSLTRAVNLADVGTVQSPDGIVAGADPPADGAGGPHVAPRPQPDDASAFAAIEESFARWALDTFMQFYDRNGNPISAARHAYLKFAPRGDDERVDVVAKTWHGDVEVSTCWLGWNMRHDPASGPPLIFETMMLGGEGDTWGRYATEAAAQTGHRAAVGWLRIHHPLPALPQPASSANDSGRTTGPAPTSEGPGHPLLIPEVTRDADLPGP
jgi:hypothetical protein